MNKIKRENVDTPKNLSLLCFLNCVKATQSITLFSSTKERGTLPSYLSPPLLPLLQEMAKKRFYMCFYIVSFFLFVCIHIFFNMGWGPPSTPPPLSAYGLKTTKQQSMQTVPHPKMISITASDVRIGETKKFN